MSNMLSPQEWNKLSEELSLPLLVREQILKEEQAEHHVLLMAALIDEMRSDTLLLSLACSLKIIAELKQKDEPDIAKFLNYHADFVVDDYAPHWHKFKNGLMPADWAQHVEEDLEGMTDTLLLTRDAFAFRDDTLYKICDCLASNLNYFLANKAAQNKAQNFQSLDANIFDNTEWIGVSNIIQFPFHRRNI